MKATHPWDLAEAKLHIDLPCFSLLSLAPFQVHSQPEPLATIFANPQTMLSEQHFPAPGLISSPQSNSTGHVLPPPPASILQSFLANRRLRRTCQFYNQYLAFVAGSERSVYCLSCTSLLATQCLQPVLDDGTAFLTVAGLYIL